MKKIVTIGGGTGSYTLLLGLKKYPVKISAIVSMADDGGSTGLLRDELGVLPPGDVRQCLVALSEAPEMMRRLMNYRFGNGGLGGHTFGNIFLSALQKTAGSFSLGVREAMRILTVRGEVIPVSGGDMRLFVELLDGRVIEGENQLDHNTDIQKVGLKRVYLKPKVKASRGAIARILAADAVIIGPGDQYGSIIPNLLVSGISEAIQKTKARVIYNCNLTNKKGQTTGWTADDFVASLEAYIGSGRVNCVIINTETPPKHLVQKYERREGKGSLVTFPSSRKKRTFTPVLRRVVSRISPKGEKGDTIAETRSFIRHSSAKLARAVMEAIESR